MRASSRRTRALGLACLAFVLCLATAAKPHEVSTQPQRTGVRVAVLCYHDLSNDPGASSLTVSPEALREQIRSAKAAGWSILPLSTVLARAHTGGELPPRVLVLTFDDGYRSFLEQALPILKEEQAPATLAIVSGFIDAPPADLPPLLSWKQIREVRAGGLVEIASHTHDLHRWVTSNPYRDTRHAVSTREYFEAKARYETRAEYRERIGADLRRAQQVLRTKLGEAAEVLVWPYGEHTEMARAEATAAGFRAGLALGDREASLEDLRAGLVPRILVTRATSRSWNGADIAGPADPARAAQLELDALYAPEEAKLRENIDRTIVELRRLGANLVVLRGFAGRPGDGKPPMSYFVNHQVPVQADVWSMVAAKLHHAGFKVWMSAPTMELTWAWQSHPEWRIPREGKRHAASEPDGFRLSPDLPAVRDAAADLYADAAVYLPIDGVLFDDDLFMNADECLAVSGSCDPGAKSEAMRELTAGVMRTVRAWRPNARFGRKIEAAAVSGGPAPNRESAQDLGMFLRTYDLTVVSVPASGASAKARTRPTLKIAREALARFTGSGPAPLLFLFDPENDVIDQTRVARQAGITQVGIRLLSATGERLPDKVLASGFAAGVKRPRSR